MTTLSVTSPALQKVFHAFVNRGQTPKSSGNQFLVSCPCHDDSKASLSLTAKDGKAMLNCFAGCKPEAIVAALGLKMCDLFDNNHKPDFGTPRKEMEKKSKVVETYYYHDGNRVIRYAVDRKDNKDFPQKRPDPNKKGQWIWNMQGVKLLPYRYPQLLDSSRSKWIILTEGEKDVHTAEALGFLATTFSGGALTERKRKTFIESLDTDSLEVFRGRFVVIIVDNDAAGRVHGKLVYELLKGIADRVIIIELPGLAEKEDLTDWVGKGGTKEQLEKLILELIHPDRSFEENFEVGSIEEEKAPTTEKVREQSKKAITYEFNPMSSAEFAEADFSATWIIEEVLVANEPAVRGGPKKSLKTTQGIDEIISIASGTDFLNKFKVLKKSRCAFISGESGRGAIQDIANRICEPRGLQLKNLDIYWDFRLPQLSNPDHMDVLTRRIEELGIEVAAIDPLYLCLLSGHHIGGDVAKNLYDMGALFTELGNRFLQVKCTPILMHHANGRLQPGQPMEMGDLAFAGISEWMRQWILINPSQKYDGEGIHKLWLNIGNNYTNGSQWGVEIDERYLPDQPKQRRYEVTVTSASESYAIQSETKKSAKEEKKQKDKDNRAKDVLEAIASLSQVKPYYATKTAIHGATGISKPHIDNALAKLEYEKKIIGKAVQQYGDHGQWFTGYNLSDPTYFE